MRRFFRGGMFLREERSPKGETSLIDRTVSRRIGGAPVERLPRCLFKCPFLGEGEWHEWERGGGGDDREGGSHEWRGEASRSSSV